MNLFGEITKPVVVEEPAAKKLDLFKEIVPSILQTDVDLTGAIRENPSQYNLFMVNRSLSFHIDCVLHVAELNRFPDLDEDQHYHYLKHAIRKYKRKWQPWQKAETVSPELALVKKFYGYTREKAKDALRILTKEQLQEIKARMDTGGTSK